MQLYSPLHLALFCPMDPKFALRFLLLLLLTSPLFVTNSMQAEAVQPHGETNQHEPSEIINGVLVSIILSDKGYHALSLTLDILLEAVNPNSTVTLFCPLDKAFFNSKYPQPPLTLLKYHAVPFKVDKVTRLPWNGGLLPSRFQGRHSPARSSSRRFLAQGGNRELVSCASSGGCFHLCARSCIFLLCKAFEDG